MYNTTQNRSFLSKTMTADTLISALQNPGTISEMPQAQLQNMVDKYPYCNCLRLLHVKKLKIDQHISFERHLALASTYASDRKQLFDFMHASVLVSKSTEVPTKDKYLSSQKKKLIPSN